MIHNQDNDTILFIVIILTRNKNFMIIIKITKDVKIPKEAS